MLHRAAARVRPTPPAIVLTFAMKDGAMAYDSADEIQAATVITRDGEVVQEATRKLLQPAATEATK